jgi:predicted Zn-dependent protease
MPAFFRDGRRTQLGGRVRAAALHPVTSARIAESKGRAAQPTSPPHDAMSYALMKERVRAHDACGVDPRQYYASMTGNEPGDHRADLRQGARADDRRRRGRVDRGFEHLRSAHPEVMQFHTALGQAQLSAGQVKAAVDTLERARNLAPRNVPVTLRFAEALLRANRPKKAHEILLDLFNNVPPTQEQIR